MSRASREKCETEASHLYILDRGPFVAATCFQLCRPGVMATVGYRPFADKKTPPQGRG